MLIEFPELYTNNVVIEDYIIGSKYELLLVDGEPVKRSRGYIYSKAPYALVAPGKHVLTVKVCNFFDNKDYEPQQLQVNIESGSRYRIVDRDGKPVLLQRRKRR